MPAWTPSPEWKDQEAFLIGGGGSLTGFDFTRLRGRNVIGCNDAWHLGADIVSICLFGDSSWWEKNKFALSVFAGRVVTCAPTCLSLNLPWLLQMKRIRDGYHEGDTLGWNNSTGAAAINLAVLLGATRIYLLGYDMGVVGKFHWHEYNTKKLHVEPFIRFKRGFHNLANSLAEKKPAVKVLNVTDGSSMLPVFDRITFAELFASLPPNPTALPGSPLDVTCPSSTRQGFLHEAMI